MRSLLFFLCMLTATGCSPSYRQLNQPVTVSLDNDEVGKPPADFSIALTGGGGPVFWNVRQDADLNGKKVIVQESADDTSYRFPLCIYDKAVTRDVAVEVKFKAIAGKTDQAGGLVLRYSPENYYIARANALEDNIDLFKVVNGFRSKIDEVDAKVAPNQWHTIRFEAAGWRLKVIFDGKTVIDKKDETFSEPGKVGLWTKADSMSAFTDLKIVPIWFSW